jgi:hypothetical protein
MGVSDTGVAVWGSSKTYEGVHAETQSTRTAALAAIQANTPSDSAAPFARHDGNRTAAVFVGNVHITRHIQFENADCAEECDIAAESSAAPGTVMVLDDEGQLREAFRAYDKRVAGVISAQAPDATRQVSSSTGSRRGATGHRSRFWARSSVTSTPSTGTSRLATC